MQSTDFIPLLHWYKENKRQLPWRSDNPDPYHVLISEIMLQQTTVATILKRFDAFIDRFPTINHLAQSDIQEVLHAWQGLGYYSRARRLHLCARTIVEQHQGVIPTSETKLQNLPGIGAYTANAVAAIAFSRPVLPVDTNVARVMARLFAIETKLPALSKEVQKILQPIGFQYPPREMAQALMELGAMICRPALPLCTSCPMAQGCEALKRDMVSDLPRMAPKKAKKDLHTTAFAATTKDGLVLLRKRPETGILAGLIEVPSSPWQPGCFEHRQTALSQAPFRADWQCISGQARHVFTHINLAIKVERVTIARKMTCEGFWHPVERLSELALPAMTKKILRHGFVTAAE